MDLPAVTDLIPATGRAELTGWRPGDAFLAGGSWLFSEPQPDVRRLIDLSTLGWPPVTVTGEGLEIAATCTLAELHDLTGFGDSGDSGDPGESDDPRPAGLPPEWIATTLFRPACRALLGSFKVWNVATVGGNICLSLPAAPMTSLAASLDGVGLIWSPDGTDRQVPIAEFVTGDTRNVLEPGELLRSITLPAEALASRTAFRQLSLTPMGRSGVLVIGRQQPERGIAVFTVTASTPRPVQFRFDALPGEGELLAAVDAAEATGRLVWFDDVHGRPAWRAAQTRRLLTEVRAELAAAA